MKMRLFFSLYFVAYLFLSNIYANPVVTHDDQESSLNDLDDKEKEEIKEDVFIEEEIGSRFIFPDEIHKAIQKSEANFQVDIILPEEQREIMEDEIGMRTGKKNDRYRWPKSTDGLVRVPYLIDNEFSEYLIRSI
jgi:hypothetical protein